MLVQGFPREILGEIDMKKNEWKEWIVLVDDGGTAPAAYRTTAQNCRDAEAVVGTYANLKGIQSTVLYAVEISEIEKVD